MDQKDLRHLGSQGTKYQYDSPSPEILDTFINKHQDQLYLVPFIQPRDEFSSLCISGDTLIDIARDEIKLPQAVPIRDLVGTEGIVFGFDLETKQPVARRYYSVRKTRVQAPVVKVFLEHLSGNGHGGFTRLPKEIIMTPDHLVLVSTGWHKFTWVKASDLQEGMRLIADQRSTDTIRGKARHRLIKECQLGRYLEDGELVHHKDHRHYNNEPENLQTKDLSSHHSHHQTIRYGYNESLPPIKELVEMYNSGENLHSLAIKFNCDDSTIESRIGSLVEKRPQRESLLAKPESLNLRKLMAECKSFYEQGYTTYELSEFYGVHGTTISQWIIKSGGQVRTSLETKEIRKKAVLPSLNHRVVKVEDFGCQDVYNLEVEDVENFFGNGVVLHNCPVTGQPDQASMEIIYVPNVKMVESKSLKLYFFSFRNSGEFHEDVTNRIAKDLWSVLEPKYLRVFGNFAPRGGIAIKPLVERWQENGLPKTVILAINRMVTAWDLKNAR